MPVRQQENDQPHGWFEMQKGTMNKEIINYVSEAKQMLRV
jgi:hypothetical protein